MNHAKAMMCSLAAMLLCAGMLAGCGNRTQTETGAEASVSAADAAPEKAAETQEPATEEQNEAPDHLEAARAVLAGFLEGCLSHDVAAVDAAADYRGMLSAFSGETFTDEEWQTEAADWLFDAFDSYEIGTGSSSAEELETYNTGMRQVLTELEEHPDPDDDAETLRCIAYLKDTFREAEGFCSFPVTLSSEDGAQTDTLKLVQTEGSWKIDLCEGVVKRIAMNRMYREDGEEAEE